MKRDIPEKVTETLKDIGMNVNNAGWDCHGTFVLLHKALEKVAVKNKITFDKPEILECNSERRIASLIVTGHMGDKSEWSIGEASPSNNKNSYPYAMAEKRAKDRVILKLLGLHGDVYAEDEADSFKEERPEEIKGGTNETKDLDSEPEVKVNQIDGTTKDVKGLAMIKEVFVQFLPSQSNRTDLVGFWKNNQKAREILKEKSPKDYEEVEKLFKEKMMETKYPATGSLFTQKEKRSEKSPDYSGGLTLEMEVLDDLIKQKEEGILEPKMNLVGWKKVSKAGNPYLRIIANIERDRQDKSKYQKPIPQNNVSDDKLDDEIPF